MTKANVKCCRTCAFAEYLRTPTGRPVKGETVRCRYPVAGLEAKFAELVATLPESFQHIQVSVIPHGRSPEDGELCSGYRAAKESSDGE